jgi:hypothetical protein
MDKQKRERSNDRKNSEVNSVPEDPQSKGSDNSSQKYLTINDSILHAHKLSFILFRNTIDLKKANHITSLTDPQDRSTITTNDSSHNRDNQSDYFIEIHYIQRIT